MNYDIRLLGLDLDGTVFNDKKQITNNTIVTISNAIKKGVIIVPATGRPYSGLPKEFISIPGIRYALTSNGSSIFDLKEQKVIYSDLIEVNSILKILDVALTFDSIIDVYIDGFSYAPNNKIEDIKEYMQSDIMAAYFLKTRVFFEGDIKELIQFKNKPMEKIQMLFRDMNVRNEAIKRLNQFTDISITSALPNNLEINSSTANKGNGLLALGNHLGITKEQIMTCGDSGNDYEMIRIAGLGVAMENATEEIKTIADYISLSNNEDGVAHAIKKFIL